MRWNQEYKLKVLVGKPYPVSPGVPCRDVARYVST